jgi:putative membrane protein
MFAFRQDYIILNYFKVMRRVAVFQWLAEKENISILIIWLLTLIGLLGIGMGYGDWFLPKTIFNQLVGVALLIWNFPLKRGWKSMAIWSSVYLIGMTAEIIGVNTGILFGDYSYGHNLGPTIVGVPPLIGFNWLVLTFLTGTIAKRFMPNYWLAIIGGAFLMVGLDFFMEPTAPIFDFWHWQGGVAPLKNYIHWFLVALLLQVIVVNDLPEKKQPLPMHHFISQLLFFIFFYFLYTF